MPQVPPTEHTHAQPTDHLTRIYILTDLLTTLQSPALRRRTPMSMLRPVFVQRTDLQECTLICRPALLRCWLKKNAQ